MTVLTADWAEIVYKTGFSTVNCPATSITTARSFIFQKALEKMRGGDAENDYLRYRGGGDATEVR